MLKEGRTRSDAATASPRISDSVDMRNKKATITAFVISILMIVASTAVGATVFQDSNAEITTHTLSPAKARRVIASRAKQVILAIKRRDMTRLSTFIHPNRGVRFTPYNYVSLKDDLIFRRGDIKGLMSSKEKYVWGNYEGSGDPIRLTFTSYYKRFIYDHDFASMPGVSYDTFNTRGSADNPWEFYPGAIIVGYYFPGIEGPRGGAMDWKGLRLVFQPKGKTWYLVGILHDEWLI